MKGARHRLGVATSGRRQAKGSRRFNLNRVDLSALARSVLAGEVAAVEVRVVGARAAVRGGRDRAEAASLQQRAEALVPANQRVERHGRMSLRQTADRRPVGRVLQRSVGIQLGARQQVAELSSLNTAHAASTLGRRRGAVVSGVRRMNEVNARRARLLPGWVTVFGRVYHLGM